MSAVVHLEMEAVARVLRKARCAKGWSQQELADMVGIGVSTVHRYEAGNPRSTEVVLKLCVALRIELGRALLEDKQEPGRARW